MTKALSRRSFKNSSTDLPSGLVAPFSHILTIWSAVTTEIDILAPILLEEKNHVLLTPNLSLAHLHVCIP